MTTFTIRKADPRDAAELVDLARAVSTEPGGWLLSEDGWRSVGEERRYLRAVRRHPDAVYPQQRLALADVRGGAVEQRGTREVVAVNRESPSRRHGSRT